MKEKSALEKQKKKQIKKLYISEVYKSTSKFYPRRH